MKTAQDSRFSFLPEFPLGSAMAGRGRCLVIAEIGPNHDGDPETAMALVKAAAQAGCDGVKFQYRLAEHEIFDRTTQSYYYNEARFDFIKRVQEFPHETHAGLRRYAKDMGLLYLCSVFCEEAVDMVADLAPDAIKIPSGEVGNPWVLDKAAALRLPLVASSGMSPIEEIDAMMLRLNATTDKVLLLHCVSEYPTPLSAMQLSLIAAYRQRYGCPTGLSDHSRNIPEVAASAALDAAMIEVHFTFDRGLRGPDHHISLLPDEMACLIAAVRRLEEALGEPVKKLGEHAAQMRGSFSNSIVARRDITPGETLTRENLCLKKPGTGLSPDELPRVLGSRAVRPIGKDTPLGDEDFTR